MLKRSLTIVLLFMLLAEFGFGFTKRATDQISDISYQFMTDEESAEEHPLMPGSSLSHHSYLIQFVEEASGMLSRRGREIVRRTSSSAKDAKVRIHHILLLLIIAILALLCCRPYFSLPGIYVLSSSGRIIFYQHDQDGLK